METDAIGCFGSKKIIQPLTFICQWFPSTRYRNASNAERFHVFYDVAGSFCQNNLHLCDCLPYCVERWNRMYRNVHSAKLDTVRLKPGNHPLDYVRFIRIIARKPFR